MEGAPEKQRGRNAGGRATGFAIVGAGLLAGATPAGARLPSIADPGRDAAILALVAKDLRVATVAYRVQTNGLRACARRTALPGLVIGDASQYRADLRPAVASLFGIGDVPAVTAVVPGSPADTAGLRAGDQLQAIDGTSLRADTDRPPARSARSDRFTWLVNLLTDRFARGPVTLAVRRGDREFMATLTGTAACESMVQLDLGGARNAGADGRTVTVSQGLYDFVRSDDELAVVIAHELAHNILGHRALIASASAVGDGIRSATVRQTERAADYLGLYLVAWAGYDIDAAPALWTRMESADGLLSILPDPSHPPTRRRVADLRREAIRIRSQRSAGRPVLPDPAGLTGQEG